MKIVAVKLIHSLVYRRAITYKPRSSFATTNVMFSTLSDSIRSQVRQTINNLEQQQQEEALPKAENPDDEGIHPDWLALERRVKNRKPRPRVDPNQASRSERRVTGWDGENV